MHLPNSPPGPLRRRTDWCTSHSTSRTDCVYESQYESHGLVRESQYESHGLVRVTAQPTDWCESPYESHGLVYDTVRVARTAESLQISRTDWCNESPYRRHLGLTGWLTAAGCGSWPGAAAGLRAAIYVKRRTKTAIKTPTTLLVTVWLNQTT
jgi:hypothetical protein